MKSRLTNIGLAAGIFVVITGSFLWFSGTFSRASTDGKHESHAAVEEHDHEAAGEHDRGAAKVKDACCPDDAPAGKSASAQLPDLKAIESKFCEHKIRQLDCNECRYELGVVKVQPSVSQSLTKTAVVQERDLTDRLQLTGEVQFDQTTLVDVLPVALGRVVSVKARLGQKVQQGELLAVIRSGELGEAKAAYLEAAATADVAAKEKDRQASVAAALANVVDRLSKGHSLNGGAPLGEWKSKLVGASARLQQARTVQERETALVAKQASSKAELESAQRELQIAEAEYTALLEEIQLNVKLDRLKAENAATLAQAKLTIAEQRLHLFGLADPAIRGLVGAKTEASFALLEIRSPRTGFVTAQNITEGKLVETSQSLFTVADTSNVWVWCDLYERDLGTLHEHTTDGKAIPAFVRVRAFREPIGGKLDLIASAINETSRTVKVRVQVPNEQGRLKPGMFAEVTVELPTGKKAALAPHTAVLRDDGKAFVFQHWKADLWLKREVVVGKSQGDLVEITSGIQPGSEIVQSGAFLFKSDVLRAKMGAGCAD